MPRSMRHEQRSGREFKKIARDSAENLFAQAPVTVAAHDDKIGSQRVGLGKQCSAFASAGVIHVANFRLQPSPRQVCGCVVAGACAQLALVLSGADDDDRDPAGLLQKGSGVSDRAFNEFQKYLESPEGSLARNYVIVVQKSRDASNELARLVGVEHESPQAIIVRNGRAVWNDSHLAIKSQRLSDAVNDAN